MQITSNDFLNNGEIPSEYACDGENVNPFLRISEISEQAKNLVLIVDDPDAPGRTWVHWIVFNIPIFGKELKIQEDSIPQGGILGQNDFKKLDYGGPCPPFGTHHYFFKVYALDSRLDLKEGATKKQVEEAMKNHIISSVNLVGLYSRR